MLFISLFSGNSVSSHEGKLNILKRYYEKLGSELHVEPFDDSCKEEVCNSVKSRRVCHWNIHISMKCWIKKLPVLEVSHVIKDIKNNKSAG